MVYFIWQRQVSLIVIAFFVWLNWKLVCLNLISNLLAHAKITGFVNADDRNQPQFKMIFSLL